MRELTFPIDRTDKMYLKVHVAEGSSDDKAVEFNVSTTMGISGMAVLLTVTHAGETVTEILDLHPRIEEWVTAIVADIDAKGEIDGAATAAGD